MAIAQGSWEVWQRFYAPISEAVVEDWGELKWEDLWRNPEVGLTFCRAVGRAQR